MTDIKVEYQTAWPNDADGDVMRRLEAGNFDFDKEYDVDFNVDFDNWPPPEEAIALLISRYGAVSIVEPEAERDGEKDQGYLSFKITARITYEFVTKSQREITMLMQEFGGWCDSWGVLSD